MEYLICAVAIILLIALLMLKGYIDYKRSEKLVSKRLYEEYGTLPQKEYKPEQFASISHYFQNHREKFIVDDITWNDLNMDEMFKMLKRSQHG